MKIFLRIFALILFAQVCLFAQFGKNKVQYKYFDWYYVQTKHFDIYFANGGETLAEFTTHIAEDALSKIQESLTKLTDNYQRLS